MTKTIYITTIAGATYSVLIDSLAQLEEELPGELIVSDCLRIDAVSPRACQALDRLLASPINQEAAA